MYLPIMMNAMDVCDARANVRHMQYLDALNETFNEGFWHAIRDQFHAHLTPENISHDNFLGYKTTFEVDIPIDSINVAGLRKFVHEYGLDWELYECARILPTQKHWKEPDMKIESVDMDPDFLYSLAYELPSTQCLCASALVPLVGWTYFGIQMVRARKSEKMKSREKTKQSVTVLFSRYKLIDIT